MRIVSLLASGTELVCALGEGASLVGRSHECDDPPAIAALPALSRPTFDVSGSSAEIDRLVRERLRSGAPLYEIDHERLRALAPDLVVTQSHCDVCAVGPGALDGAHAIPGLEGLRTVAMSGGSLDGVLRDFRAVAAAVGRAREGAALVEALEGLRERWRAATAPLRRPRVVCLEWIEPPFPMGNWGPELVELAGGNSRLGAPNAHSSTTTWEAIRAADPEVLVVAPCGFDLERALAELPTLAAQPGFTALQAVRAGRVYVCDGNRHFNRSGPALFETIEILAEILHPDRFAPAHEGRVWRRWAGEAPHL